MQSLLLKDNDNEVLLLISYFIDCPNDCTAVLTRLVLSLSSAFLNSKDTIARKQANQIDVQPLDLANNMYSSLDLTIGIGHTSKIDNFVSRCFGCV